MCVPYPYKALATSNAQVKIEKAVQQSGKNNENSTHCRRQ